MAGTRGIPNMYFLLPIIISLHTSQYNFFSVCSRADLVWLYLIVDPLKDFHAVSLLDTDLKR